MREKERIRGRRETGREANGGMIKTRKRETGEMTGKRGTEIIERRRREMGKEKKMTGEREKRKETRREMIERGGMTRESIVKGEMLVIAGTMGRRRIGEGVLGLGNQRLS